MMKKKRIQTTVYFDLLSNNSISNIIAVSGCFEQSCVSAHKMQKKQKERTKEWKKKKEVKP